MHSRSGEGYTGPLCLLYGEEVIRVRFQKCTVVTITQIVIYLTLVIVQGATDKILECIVDIRTVDSGGDGRGITDALCTIGRPHIACQAKAARLP
ncbi:hypothetical protein D3C72_1351400 [compost metagenome]